MLSQDVERYINLQQTLGFKFGDQSCSLKLFANYAGAHGDEFVRVERVLAWAAAQTPSAQRRQTLVARVRRFALAMHAESQRHEVPPRDCVGHAKIARKPPYIYSSDEIDRIMRTAGQMPAKGFISPATLATMLGLMASTGLRISEVLALECPDVGDDGLVIRKSKHGKSRLIPLHDTTQAALDRHLSERARHAVYTKAVFVSNNGQALMYPAIRDTFRRLMVRAGLRREFSGTGPRMHDLRHTFAVRSLEQCRPDRQAVALHMSALSTYLGHAHVTDTYWYLEATPIIMRGIATAGEAMHHGGHA
jgi:integrase